MMNPVAMDAARHHVLQNYHISPEARLSSGMEAEVYACGLNAVLKLYTGTTTLADLHILQDFYNLAIRSPPSVRLWGAIISDLCTWRLSQ